MKFMDRIEELELLGRLWERDSALVVIYGKRRVGKTRLIQEFTSGRDTFFFTFSNTKAGVQLQEFRTRAAEHLGDGMILNMGGDWYDTLRFFFRSLEDGTTVVLDEFTYAIKADKKILSDLQRLWDQELRERTIKLIICGSMLGMVKDDVLSHTSPLYGRRTRDIQLRPFGYRHAVEFFPDPEYGLQAYMVVGGMPEYLLVATEYTKLEDLISHEFLNQRGYFFRELYYMLSQDLKVMKTYFAILNAISYGNTKPTEIAHFIGAETRSLYPYLETLKRLEFIRREVALGGERKKGIYKISDPMIYSWFNIVYKKRDQIEIGIDSVPPQEISSMLGCAFETLAREFIAEINHRDGLGATSIGRWWHKGEEIDLVCLDPAGRNVFLFETKYAKLVLKTSTTIINSLKRKAGLTPWPPEKWNIHYGLIAKEITGKEKIKEKGYLCYDMKDIISLARRT